jgi:hypothetical protein
MMDLYYAFPYNTFGLERIMTSYIRLFHAVPDAPAVDVYSNNIPIARNLTYRSFTEYFPVMPGNYTITVYPTGQTVNPVINTNVSIPDRSIFTAAAVGRLSNIALQLIPDPPRARTPGRVNLRFGHLSPNAPSVDILSDGRVLFQNIPFRQVTDYITLTPGRYNFRLRVTGSNQIVLYVPNIRLLPNRFLTIYAIGLAGSTPPLQVVIPMDGNTYLQV